MRVLVVSHTYIAPVNRKKWQVLCSLYPNVHVTVLFPKRWASALFEHCAESDFSGFNLSNCEFVALDSFKSGNEVLYFYHPIKLFKLIKSVKPDLIHVEQGVSAISYAQCILFSKLLKLNSKNIFFTWVNWRHKFSKKYNLFLKKIENFNLKYSSGALVGNADAAKILVEKGFSKNIRVLPQLGVDMTIFKPGIFVSSQNPEISKSTKTIGFVGRLVEEKGIFDLLDAFECIYLDHSDWRLVYLGRGACKDKLENQINTKGLQAQISIQSTVPHDQVAEFIKSIDIMVLPSYDTDDWREQFGHVLIEAMACKVPIIGSDAGEIPNVISGFGLVFEQKNIKSLQQALQKLITNDALRYELSAKGYDKVIEKYSHQAVAHSTYDFWNKIIKGDRCG